MSNTTRDLAVWYPIVPWSDYTAQQYPDIVTHILDAHIEILIDACELEPSSGSVFSCYISSITPTAATVMFTLGDTSRTISVPVYIGRDAIPFAAANWIVMDASMSYSEAALELHPSCVVIEQRPPELTIYDRGAVNIEEQQTGSYRAYPEHMLTFTDGNNVDVTYINDTIIFTGAAGAGAGVFTIPPYSDGPAAYQTYASIGLRSINGLTGAVIIDGSDTVSVSAESDNAGGVVLTITARESKLI